MIHTELNKGNIGNLLARYETALKNNKPPSTLFDVEPNWKALNDKYPRCPICNSLLKFPRGKYIAMCRGLRHGDRKPFIIHNKKLMEIQKQNQTLAKLKKNQLSPY